jgi:hypothetical protein
MCRHMAELLRDARRRGDLYAETNFRTGVLNIVWLVEDDPTRARREVEDAMKQWSNQGFHVQHFYELLALTNVDVYVGDGMTAYARAQAKWPLLESSMLLRVQAVLLTSLDVRMRSAICAAAQIGATTPAGTDLLRAAERDAKRIEAEGMRWAVNLAKFARGGIAYLRGKNDEAVARIHDAAAGFAKDDAKLFHAAAQRCLGKIAGGETGARMIADAEAALRAESIRDPARFAAVMAPAFR